MMPRQTLTYQVGLTGSFRVAGLSLLLAVEFAFQFLQTSNPFVFHWATVRLKRLALT